jgi:hypothetical protein
MEESNDQTRVARWALASCDVDKNEQNFRSGNDNSVRILRQGSSVEHWNEA